MMRKLLLIPITVLLLSLGVIAALPLEQKAMTENNIVTDGTAIKNENAITYGTDMKVWVNGEFWDQNSNVITDIGKDHIKQLVGLGISSDAVNRIVLGNGTAPASGDTSHSNEITNCGLAGAAGTYYSEGTGNWTIGYTWTSTCTIVVNTTGLYNASGGTYFAGTTFTAASLTNGDQITVNYTKWVI
jgi:hypothetical protein